MRQVIALVAGETSGDQLGAALIHALSRQNPKLHFAGIGGPLMQAAGMDIWWNSSQLAVMGLAEVIAHLPRLLKLRRQLIKRLISLQPHIFIGIDSPDFNLGVEKKLKSRMIPVIHYVSPTIWAWRPGRVKSIARATDRVLCLFPFEPGYYPHQSVAADYTGHPLADQIPLHNNAADARQKLGIKASGVCIALLPGSRHNEVSRLTTPMLDAATVLQEQYPGMVFLLPAATQSIHQYLRTALDTYPDLNCHLFDARSIEVMTAADAVICASGTATLEAMLVNRPLVVCYRLAALTFWLAKSFRLVKSRFFALPNVLASQALVPELLQHDVNGQRIAQEISAWLEQPERRAAVKQRFDQLHRNLRTDAAATAANVVLMHIKNAGRG